VHSSKRSAKRSAKAVRKAATRRLDNGTPAHSFTTLLQELSSVVRNTCRTPHAANGAQTFEVVTTPNPKQQRALELVQQIRV
jgi:hypothetical protein